jgi:hypothetical protein
VRCSLIIAALVSTLLARPALADEPGVATSPADEPAADRPARAAVPRGLLARRDRGPRMKLSYRTFAVGDQGGRSARYHSFGVDGYFLSTYVRLGGGFEGAIDTTEHSNYLMTGNLVAGLQYPSRLNPFLDAVIGFGFYRRNIVHQDLYEFAYHVGLEAGTDFYVTSRLFISAAIGWRRAIFRQPSDEQIQSVYVYFDSLLVRLGFGF